MLFFYRRRSEDLAENSDSLDEFAVKSHSFKKMRILMLCFFYQEQTISSLSFTLGCKRPQILSQIRKQDFYGQWGNEKKQIVFQDGTEVPEDFDLPTYTRKKGIKYPYKAKASEKLYLLHTSERKGIGMV